MTRLNEDVTKITGRKERAALSGQWMSEHLYQDGEKEKEFGEEKWESLIIYISTKKCQGLKLLQTCVKQLERSPPDSSSNFLHKDKKDWKEKKNLKERELFQAIWKSIVWKQGHSSHSWPSFENL